MNSLAWIGIIVWGVFLTVFGLVTADPAATGAAADMQAHDVLFLISGGMVTCLIGAVGLLGFMGWIPGMNLHSEQKSYS